MLCQLDRKKFAELLEENTASIFRVEEWASQAINKMQSCRLSSRRWGGGAFDLIDPFIRHQLFQS
jgi:hypothetical protein